MFVGNECGELQCEILDFTGNIATAWGKLFKRSFLEKYNLKHNSELRQGSEGIEFNIRVFEKVKRAVFTDKIYYHYIFNPNSISAKHNEKNHYFVIRCFEEIRKQIKLSRNRNALEKLFFKRFSYVIVATAISGYFSPANTEPYSEKKKKYLQYIREPLVKETLKKISLNECDLQRGIILTLIKAHCFFPLIFIAKIRYKQKHGD